MVEKSNVKEVTEALNKMEITDNSHRQVWQKKDLNQNEDPNQKQMQTSSEGYTPSPTTP